MPTPTSDRVAGDRLAARQAELLDPPVATAGALQHRAGQHPHPFAAVQLGEPGAELLAEDRRQRGRQRLDHRHLDAELAGSRGDLLADEAGADDRQPGARDQLLAQAPRVGERAQGVDVLEAGEEWQPARRASGRDQQLLVAQLDAGVEGDGAGFRVQRLGPGAQQQLDLFLLVPPGGAIGDRLLLHGPREQLLGERGAVVRGVGLGAGHPHRAFVAAAAQRLGTALRGEAAADDQNAWVSHHASSGTGVGWIAPRWWAAGRLGRRSRAPWWARSS